jgi:tetratricopeptide (TPR) repeat protein
LEAPPIIQGKVVTDFFISYTQVDRLWAEWIAWQLEAAGYTIVIQAWDFRPGGNFVLDMQHAAAESECTIAVLSPAYLQSGFTAAEWAVAFATEPTSAQRRLLPVRIHECEPQGMLLPIVYIDLVGLEAEAARDKLLAGVQRQRAKPTREPGFPGPGLHSGTAPPLFPGATPQNLPRSGAAAFVGRAQELARLHQQLRQSDRLAITAIAGMGGIGKTELVLQYAQHHWQQGTYRGGVCWLQARQVVLDAHVSLNVGTQIVQFAQSRLQLHPPDELELTAQVAFCWHHWRAGDVLVIFDDVIDYAVMQPYLPPTDPRFKVVITTRQNFGRSVASMTIDVLDPDAALALLERLVGGERIRAAQAIAHDLCARLGYLPLGLELVGRYLARKPDLLLGQIRQRLDAKGLMTTALAQTEVGMTARLGVTAAFELSWATLSAPAQRLGCLLSMFAGDPIPWSVVEACCAEVDPEDLEETRDHELVGFNLLHREALGVYRIHTLIREFLQGKLQQQADADVLKHAVCQWVVGVAQDIPQTPTRDLIEAVTPLIPHMAEIATAFTPWVRDEDLIGLFVGLCRFYAGQGDYAQAVLWSQQSLSVTQCRLGEEHRDIATTLNNLAGLYQEQGRYSEAEPLYRDALMMRKRLLGEEHADVASSLNSLAVLYVKQGRYSEAEPLYRDALMMRKRLLGEEHRDIAATLNNLAGLYWVQGHYSEAEPLYRDALMMRKRLLGEEHPDVASSLHNLAGLYRSQGHYSEAEPLYRDALAMRKRLLGEEHPDVATTINNLAGLYEDQGRYSEAEPLYRDALAMSKRLLGEEHPRVATSLNNLAVLYAKQWQFEKAAPLLEQALRMFQQLLGNDHPSTRMVEHSLEYIKDALQGHFDLPI